MAPVKTKAPVRRAVVRGGAFRPVFLALMLLGLIGVILGQTDYGYFGMNLLTGGKLRKGKLDEARSHFERCVQRDPKAYPDAHRQLGLLYKDAGMLAPARKSFERYLALAPKGSAEAEEVRRMLERMR